MIICPDSAYMPAKFASFKNLKTMALWKISVKNSGTINGVRLEKGMSVDYVTKTNTSPLSALSQNKEQIGRLFLNKYGIDLLKAGLVNMGRLTCEKIG